jgi:predicted  nucleic acid-binding Zn-ribbon protein
MTANDEILKKVYEINQELGASDNDSSTEEIIEEKDIDNSPVYILENSISDAQELNGLRDAIEAKKRETDAKQKEIDDVEAQKTALSEKIGIINTGDDEKRNEIASNLTNLKELNDDLLLKGRELDDLYRELRDLEGKGKLLTGTIRTMVERMTKEYQEKVEAYTRLVNSYIGSSNSKEYEEAMKLVDELNKYKKFENFDAILGIKTTPKAPKEEEVSNEEKVTLLDAEPGLTEVNVDQIVTEETYVDSPEEPYKEETVKAPEDEITNMKVDNTESTIPEEAPVELDNVKMPEDEAPSLSFDNIKVDGEEPTVTEEAPTIPEEQPSIPSDAQAPVEEKPAVEMTIYLDRSSKIADSTRKGVIATIDTFAGKIEVHDGATLKLTSKNA